MNSSQSTNYYVLTCKKPTRSHNPRHFHQHQQSNDTKQMFVPHAHQQVTVAYWSRKPFRRRRGLSDREDSLCTQGLLHGIVGIHSGGYWLLDMFCQLSSCQLLCRSRSPCCTLIIHSPPNLYDEVEAINCFSIIRALLGESYPAS